MATLTERGAIPFFQTIEGGERGYYECEVLGRWQNADGRIWTPKEFLPALTLAGALEAFDRQIMREAIKQLGVWLRQGFPALLHINASKEVLVGEGFVRFLCGCAQREGVPTRFVELELLEPESFFLDEKVLNVLQELVSAGFLLAIDDFPNWKDPKGLLVWIGKHPGFIHTLKLDAVFTNSINRPSVFGKVCRLVKFAQDQGMETVIEGVETARQYKLSQDAGIGLSQGYLFSRPVSADRVQDCLV